MNSRRKGKAFELEIARILRDHGWQARRSQQYCGTEGHGDLVTDLPVHIECKHAKASQIPKWLRQAERDCGSGRAFVVIYRLDRQPIMVAMRRDVDLPAGVRLFDSGAHVMWRMMYVMVSLVDFLWALEPLKWAKQ